MTIYVRELNGSRGGNNTKAKGSRAKLRWLVSGASSRLAVESHLFVNNLVPGIFEMTDRVLTYDSLDVQHKTRQHYIAEAIYVDPQEANERQRPPEGSYKFEYDTTGGNLRIYAAKEHILSKSIDNVAKPPTDHKGAIDVQRGEARGAEIVIPVLRLTYTYSHPEGDVDEAFARTIARATGKTNNASWHGFNEGECLFLGSRGADGTNASAEAQYFIAASENLTAATLAGIAGINKKGHELLWFEFESEKDDDSKRLALRPWCCHVERVYESMSFSSVLGF